ncbi:hypothetical protein [Streptomyces sp. NPDC042319]|uniref:hypothetical protein n=1 Tax=Streptomyces sp. NPDC042319 TaxID=3154332 RepID=UPI0033FD58B5
MELEQELIPGQELEIPLTGGRITEGARRWSTAQITAAARLLRRLHDATAGMPVAGGEETVCHNDFSPLNVTFTVPSSTSTDFTWRSTG